jgi:hypothetical protein
VAQLVGAGDHERFDTDDRDGSGLDRAVAGDLDLADDLAGAGGGLRDRLRGPGQHGACGVLGVDGVALAAVATIAPVRAAGLDRPQAVPAQEADQALAVGAAAFDAEAIEVAERASPLEQLRIAARVGRDCQRAQALAAGIERDGYMNELVRVDANDDRLASVYLWHPFGDCLPIALVVTR